MKKIEFIRFLIIPVILFSGLLVVVPFSGPALAQTTSSIQIINFGATPATITAGQSTMLSWFVNPVTTPCNIGMAVPNPYTVTPTQTTTYTLSCLDSATGKWLTRSTTVTVTQPATIQGYGWSSDIGWINFGDGSATYPRVTVGDDGVLTGYAWSSNIGWIRFDPSLSGLAGASDIFSARITDNDLKGWARACSVFSGDCTSGVLKADSDRGGWDGWIKMHNITLGQPSQSVDNVSNRSMSGFAWGGLNLGWISAALLTEVVSATPTPTPTPVVTIIGTSGQCGTAKDTLTPNMPVSNLCSSGTSAVTDSTGTDGYFNWSCAGTDGSIDYCSAPRQIIDGGTDGRCGSANGIPVPSAPTAGLCQYTSTTPTVTLGNGGFSWSCTGSNGGSTGNCFAPGMCVLTVNISNAAAGDIVKDSKSYTYTPPTTSRNSNSGNLECGKTLTLNSYRGAPSALYDAKWTSGCREGVLNSSSVCNVDIPTIGTKVVNVDFSGKGPTPLKFKTTNMVTIPNTLSTSNKIYACTVEGVEITPDWQALASYGPPHLNSSCAYDFGCLSVTGTNWSCSLQVTIDPLAYPPPRGGNITYPIKITGTADSYSPATIDMRVRDSQGSTR